jgi:hypothetical protein
MVRQISINMAARYDLRKELTSPAEKLVSWVRIPLEERMSVYVSFLCLCCVVIPLGQYYIYLEKGKQKHFEVSLIHFGSRFSLDFEVCKKYVTSGTWTINL